MPPILFLSGGRRAAALRAALLAGVLFSAVSCAPGGDLGPVPEYHATAYRLGGGDQIRIITYGEDQLTGEFRVDDQGQVAVPLLGSVPAKGLTTRELEAAISGELRDRKLLKNPSVTVEVVAYRPIFVLGEVAKPGEFPFQPGMTLLTTVAVAGGFTYRAFQDYADVVRTTEGEVKEGLATPRSFIAPGDVVRVYERRF